MLEITETTLTENPDLAQTAIKAIRAKGVVAQTHIAHVHQYGVKTFDEAVSAIMELKSAQRSLEHQAYTDEFCTRSVQLLGRHLLGTVEVAGTKIAELAADLNTEPPWEPPPPKPGFIQRLLGG